MIEQFLRLLRRPKSRQAVALYAGTVLQLVLGVFTSVIVTRALKPVQYGNYSYISNLASLVLLVVSTGHFVSVGTMVARGRSENRQRSLLGTSLLVTLLLACLFSGIIFVFSFFQDYLFQDKLGYSLRLLALPLLLFPLQTYLESVLMGLNRITTLSVQRALPKALYVVALVMYMKYLPLTFFSALVLMLLTSYVVYALQIISLRPTFDDVAANLREISSENKKYGFHVYIGSLANVATTYLCTLSVGYFGNNTNLGFFNLALTVASPLALVPSVIATIFFRTFAEMDRVSAVMFKYTVGLSLFSYIVFACLLGKVVLLLYSEAYLKSVPLAIVVGLGLTIEGLGTVFNRFLWAKGRGREIRNGAFITGAVNLVALFLLVPVFGGMGAAIAKLSMGSMFFATMYYYYRGCRMESSRSWAA